MTGSHEVVGSNPIRSTKYFLEFFVSESGLSIVRERFDGVGILELEPPERHCRETFNFALPESNTALPPPKASEGRGRVG
jgi:hypothetical protein